MQNCICVLAPQSCLTMTPWTAGHQASLSFTISWSSFKFISIAWVSAAPNIFGFRWRCYLKWWFGSFSEVSQFSWMSPMNKKVYMLFVKLLSVFLVLIYLFIPEVSHSRMYNARKVIFLPHIINFFLKEYYSHFWEGRYVIWSPT